MSILASFVQFVMLQMGMAIAIIVIHVFFLQSPAKKNAFAEYNNWLLLIRNDA